MAIKNCKKHHWINDRKLQYNVITSEQKMSSRTSEASEVLFNNKTFNFGHKKLQELPLDSELKKNVITSKRKSDE